MKYEDEVMLMLAMKVMIRSRKTIERITCEHPCECRQNLLLTIGAILKLGIDVFQLRPEFHAAIVILAAGVKEMVDEMKKMESGKVINL